jgi:hypothetical protein
VDWRLHAHTSPVYVFRGGQPIRVPADRTALADYVRMVMEVYRRGGHFATPQQWQELLANCERALAFYESGL